MGRNTKHIFGDLQRGENEEEINDLLRGASLKDTRATVLKRMILEVLPFLGEWIRDNYQEDPQAMKVLDEVRKEKNQYKNVNEKGWNQFLEDLTQLRPEVHVWKNPPESSLWLSNPKNHPFLNRAQELLEAQEDETLLIGWHQYCGLLVCEILQDEEDSLPKQIRGFPSLRTSITTSLYSPQERANSPYPDSQLKVWSWDKRNFEPQTQ